MHVAELDSVDYCFWCPDCEEPRDACRCDKDEYEDLDDDPENEVGCCFPERCLMPAEHMKSECHDAEMVEAYARESTGNSGQ